MKSDVLLNQLQHEKDRICEINNEIEKNEFKSKASEKIKNEYDSIYAESNKI